MQLILWRHGHSERFKLGQRHLERLGEEQARQGAAWLRANYGGRAIWASEAASSQETARHYAADFVVRPEINGSASEERLAALLREEKEDLILVGHSPWIGSLATLLSGDDTYLFFEEGQILVLERHGDRWQPLDSFLPAAAGQL